MIVKWKNQIAWLKNLKKIKKISTHLLTVLIIGVIVQLEQEERA